MANIIGMVNNEEFFFCNYAIENLSFFCRKYTINCRQIFSDLLKINSNKTCDKILRLY